MKLTRTLALAGVLAALPALAMAQDEAPAPLATDEFVWIMNSLLFLIGGFLVFFMAAGFAMLEGGLVRSKNVTMQMTKNVGLFSLAAIFYWLIGYNLMYPLGDWAIEGWFSGLFPAWAVLEPVGVTLADADDASYASTGSDYIFQLMFCAATASIVSGALAERIKLWPFLIFTIVLTGFIYPLTASWQWGGGWLSEAGFSDFAGSTVVHACGAAAALAGAIVLGPRKGKYDKDGKVHPMPGSNLALATLGMFILWLGWFGFNGGSQLAMGSVGDVADVSRIFSNTNMAAASGAVTALILTQVLYGKPDLTMVLNGALAGLVSITAEPLAPSLLLAGIIGAVGGVIVVLTVPMLDKFKIDDVVGAIPVHGFAGIWGTFAVVLTGTSTIGPQILGMVGIIGATFVLSLIVWLILKAVIGIRVDEEAEINGLDVSELGMEAYPEFSKGGSS
ncbi:MULTISPECIES: ammonium transporter [unclassified Rhodosalinus]|uniref:ammonium transporter n=1 Tax=unclassified Rhodosalinus TaxID=2630183 RepID=UPI00352477BD